MRLSGKVVMVTGAAKGTGRVFALEMAREGASLVIMSKARGELSKTDGMIRRAGGKVLSFVADTSRAPHIKEVVYETVAALGRIDVLVNNAAVIGPLSPICDLGEDEWDRVLGTNLKGAFLFSKAVVPHMVKQGGGKIINVISGLGEVTVPLLGAYSIAKEGIIQLTRLLAKELKAYNIQVNGLYHDVLTRKAHLIIK